MQDKSCAPNSCENHGGRAQSYSFARRANAFAWQNGGKSGLAGFWRDLFSLFCIFLCIVVSLRIYIITFCVKRTLLWVGLHRSSFACGSMRTVSAITANGRKETHKHYDSGHLWHDVDQWSNYSFPHTHTDERRRAGRTTESNRGKSNCRSFQGESCWGEKIPFFGAAKPSLSLNCSLARPVGLCVIILWIISSSMLWWVSVLWSLFSKKSRIK